MNVKCKKSLIKRLGLLTVVIAALVSATACVRIDDPKKVGEKPTSTTAGGNEKETAKSNAPKVFKIGDIIQTKEFKIVVNGVRTAEKDKTGYIKPDEGMEYFLVDCTVENISDKEQVVSSGLMFKVVNKEGMQYDQRIFPDANGQLDGTVAPTRKIKGEYVVQVPKGQKGLELEFDSSMFTSGQVIVELR